MRRFLSLGAGVQSSTLYLMAVHGEFDIRPEAAIFADTQWEPAEVYSWLDTLERIGGHLIPIHRVTKGNIREAALTSTRFASMPLHATNLAGDGGLLRRQCTREYKVEPISKKIRELSGLLPRQRAREDVEQWIGISMDEVQRMKPNRLRWIHNRWPLIEKGMTRRSCELWLERNGYPTPPKSACIGCPYTDNRRWREMKDNRPGEWADAVAFDDAVRKMNRVNGDVFLHRSRKPLPLVDLSTDSERGQEDLFGNECEGMCGV